MITSIRVIYLFENYNNFIKGRKGDGGDRGEDKVGMVVCVCGKKKRRSVGRWMVAGNGQEDEETKKKLKTKKMAMFVYP